MGTQRRSTGARDHFNQIALRPEMLRNHLLNFSMVYLGIVIATLTIVGVVGPNWDLWYPHLVSPIAKNSKLSKAYADKGGTLIGLDHNYRIFVDRQSVTLEEMRRLVSSKKKLSSGRVYIKADVRCPYGWVLQIMRSCKSAGADEIHLLVLKENPSWAP